MPRALNWRAASSSRTSRCVGRAGALASWGRAARVRRRPAAVLLLSCCSRALGNLLSRSSDTAGCNHNRTSNPLTRGFDRVLAPHTEVSNRRRCRGWTMRILMGSLGLLAAAATVAQTNTSSTADTADVPTIGEIVVTAQRREESNLKVGLTLTALSSDAIAQQRVEQVLDLKGRVPNLDIKEQVPGAMPVVTIRGVGLNDFGAANSPSAGVYVDQVYVASIAMMAFDMFDLERIEVLKGPQGTLYGRNSTAGALNIITRKPQQDFAAYATLGYGNYETMDFEGAVNFPLGDAAALRLSGKTIQQGEGYWESRRLPGATI